jgi:glutamyl-tRNA reductase
MFGPSTCQTLVYQRQWRPLPRSVPAPIFAPDMTLIAFGINHNTANLDLREKAAFAPEQMHHALQAARQEVGVEEVAILSTCNRTEIYANSNQSLEPLLRWFAAYHGLAPTELRSCFYYHSGPDAARHMMKVACGLDSMVLGEPQILGQMKSAYAVADEAGSLGSLLYNAFQRVFSVAKRVRSETAIGENPVSVAYAAVSLAQQIFSNLKEDTALLIGAGETIELVARHLAEHGIKRLIVANRTLGNATELAVKFGAEAVLLSDIPDLLHRADIVVSSTASQLPLLGKGAVEAALKKRRHKPMFMIDIAVPRDIEPQVGDLADVYLYTVDDLRQVIDENMRSRTEAAAIAAEIIEEGVQSYECELRALDALDTIKSFRQNTEALRDEELAKARRALQAGQNPEDVLVQLARGLTNKFMHAPTAHLRRASSEGRQDVIQLFCQAFQVQPRESQPDEKPNTAAPGPGLDRPRNDISERE